MATPLVFDPLPLVGKDALQMLETLQERAKEYLARCTLIESLPDDQLPEEFADINLAQVVHSLSQLNSALDPVIFSARRLESHEAGLSARYPKAFEAKDDTTESEGG